MEDLDDDMLDASLDLLGRAYAQVGDVDRAWACQTVRDHVAAGRVHQAENLIAREGLLDPENAVPALEALVALRGVSDQPDTLTPPEPGDGL